MKKVNSICNKKMNDEGISLINLITTIIIIIILASIAVSISFNVIGKSSFAKYVSNMQDLEDAVEIISADIKGNNMSINDRMVYYMVANNMSIENIAIEPTGKIEELGTEILPKNIEGEEFYKINIDKLSGYKNKTKMMYSKDEEFYITDKGEVFTLPGYYNEEEDRHYINENKYYEGDFELTVVPDNITVNDLKITTDKEGENIIEENVAVGTDLYIHFNATLKSGDGTVTIMPEIPFKITENGIYEFLLESSDGSKKNYSVDINCYIDLIETSVEIGDYVEYISDVEGATTSWRVWDKIGNSIMIIPSEPLEKILLDDIMGYLTAIDKVEETCKKYTNSKLGITDKNIRSMKTEDIEKVLDNLDEIKKKFKYGQLITYKKGIFYTYEENGITVTKDTPKIATSTDKVIVKQTYYYAPCLRNNMWKPIYNTKNGALDYSNLIGEKCCWFASLASYALEGEVTYLVMGVDAEGLGGVSMFGSHYSTDNNISIRGVRPLITLDASLFMDIEGNGTSNSPWRLNRN